MAFVVGETLNGNNIRWLTYWIDQYARGNIKIHVDRNNARYARTSQEAYDNMLTLYTILSDEKTGTYLARGASDRCKDLLAGTPGTIRDFIIRSKIRIKQSGGEGSDLINDCGSDIHGTTTICGQGGVDINKLKAKTCLMTSIAGLMGVIEVVSGYNPFFHTSEYMNLQGYYSWMNKKYYSLRNTSDTYSLKDRYGVPSYNLDGVAWTPYTYVNYVKDQDNNISFIGTYDEMDSCRYGILGMLMPYSCSCYSYGRKYNDNGDTSTDAITDGDPINYIEQILYDICGLITYNTGWTDEGVLNYKNFLAYGLSNGTLKYSFTKYVKTNGNQMNLQNVNARYFNGGWSSDFNHWNGNYTKREFSNIVTLGNNKLEAYDVYFREYRNYASDNRDGGLISAPDIMPPWLQNICDLPDYQYLPWWASGIRNQPEASAVQLINSLDTWSHSLYWNSAKIQQAREAARYWYDRFGGPSDTEGIKFAGKTNYNYTIMNA